MNWFVKNVFGGVSTAPTVHPETDDDETDQIACIQSGLCNANATIIDIFTSCNRKA